MRNENKNWRRKSFVFVKIKGPWVDAEVLVPNRECHVKMERTHINMNKVGDTENRAQVLQRQCSTFVRGEFVPNGSRVLWSSLFGQ